MSQPDPADPNRAVRQRRSSILAQAKKEGINLPMNEILLGLSVLQSSITGGAGDSKANNAASKKTLIATPLGSTRASSTKKPIAYQKPVSTSVTKKLVSSIPRSNIAAMARHNTTHSGSTAKASTKAITSGFNKLSLSQTKSFLHPTTNKAPGSNMATTQGRNASGRYQPMGRRPLTGNSSTNSLRRSTSMDSNTFSMCMMTPSITPRNGMASMARKSPGSMRAWGSQGNISRDNTGTKFTVPGTKDTKVLHSMMNCVHNFLADFRYPNLFSNPTDLKNISTQTYYGIVMFVGQLLVGNKFFASKEDVVTKIIDLAVFLKYPKPPSKSHLQCANAPNSWPPCLTFLAWLCCRTRAAFQETPERPMGEFLEDFSKIAMENFLNIYLWTLQNGQKMDDSMGPRDEIIQAELNRFRAKVMERLMGESNLTVEELQAQKEEKVAELMSLMEISDPIKEVTETLENTKKKLKETLEKVEETKERIVNYKNLHTLSSQQQGLKMEIQCLDAEIATLKAEVSSQPMDKLKESKLMDELKDIQSERHYHEDVFRRLAADIEDQRELLTQKETEFRHQASMFTVVETFNAHLSRLGINHLNVPINPFGVNELEEWLKKTVAVIHSKTEKASQSLIEGCKADNEKIEEAIRRVESDISTCTGQLNTKKAFANLAQKRVVEEEREMHNTIVLKQSELDNLTTLYQSKQEEETNARTQLKTQQKTKEELNQNLAELVRRKKKDAKSLEQLHSMYAHTEATAIEKTMIWGEEVLKLAKEECIEERKQMKIKQDILDQYDSDFETESHDEFNLESLKLNKSTTSEISQ